MDQYLGEIRLFAGKYAPQGWLLCNGQSLSISTNAALYSLIGTTYGGDDRTYFNVPDLRGLMICGAGQGPGLANYALGQSFGAATVAMTRGQLPAHTHSMQASTQAATSSQPDGNVFAAAALPASAPHPPTPVAGYVSGTATGISLRNLNPAMLSSTGSSVPHTNLMPALAISYIIATEGIYPTSN